MRRMISETYNLLIFRVTVVLLKIICLDYSDYIYYIVLYYIVGLTVVVPPSISTTCLGIRINNSWVVVVWSGTTSLSKGKC